MCYYHCPSVTLQKPSLNTFYQTAQRILVHPDAQLIVVGSSRGQTMPMRYLDQRFGLKSLNLSVEGAELVTKSALIHMALEKAPIQRIIWLADFFEIIPKTINTKFTSSPALMNEVPPEYRSLVEKQGENKVESWLDHNTFEATMSFLKKKRQLLPSDWGSGSGLDPADCARPDYPGLVSAERLAKEVDLVYENYTQDIFKLPMSLKAYDLFKKEMLDLTSRGIEVDIVIAPYQPLFMRRLQVDYPEIYKQHEQWVHNLEGLAGPHLKVVNAWSGIPGGDASPKFWNDGVHYNCKAAIDLIDQLAK
jgi:hypothetical protein